MELSTLSRQFLPVDIVDEYESIIWTERYYGDSEVQLIVPATSENIQKLAIGTFLKMNESNEIMILETHDIQENRATITGISLLKWLNNRFIRVTANHEDRYWYMFENPPGLALWRIIHLMCVDMGESYGIIFPLGIPNPSALKINNLEAIHIADEFGEGVELIIPYGPIYDALHAIAVTYKVGMSITLEEATASGYRLGFRSYIGVDHTSGQSINPVVRFSPDMESFTDLKELKSIADHKTMVFTFAPSNPNDLATIPGFAGISGISASEFDLRALMVLDEELTTDTVGLGEAGLLAALTYRAAVFLNEHQPVSIIDGQIVPTGQFTYGVDYGLGSIIEVQDYSGIVQAARVIEYIRSKDNSGEKSYPTLEMLV